MRLPWTSRRAYSMSSSTNRSRAPTPIQAGGRPATLATRAGTAAAGTLDEPAGTPSSELQARRLALAFHIKWPTAGGAGRVLPVRSSSPGVDEQLEDDGDFVAVARVNRKARCMAAARALTAHGNSGAIDAELRCMGVNPFERGGVIVVKRTGIARLRSQPIVHRDNDAVAICRDPLQSGQQPGVGHHEAAAMHVKQHRLALLPRCRINDPKTTLGCTRRSGDMPLHGLRRRTRQWGHAGPLPELADYLH